MLGSKLMNKVLNIFLSIIIVLIMSNIGFSEDNKLPVYPGSHETNQFSMLSMMTGFSNHFTEIHEYMVTGVSLSDIITWYKSKFRDYRVENEGNANMQGINYAFLTLKKGSSTVGVMAFQQMGQTIYFVGKVVAKRENNSVLIHDMANGKEPLIRYPGSVMLSYSKDGKFPIYYDIKYGTKDDYEKVGEWFKKTLISKGWRIKYQSGDSDTIELEFIKDDDTAHFYIGNSIDTSYTTINLNYTERSLPSNDLVTGIDPMERYPKSVMIDYSKSTMNMGSTSGVEIKAVYLAPVDYNTVKQWYVNKLNAMFQGGGGYSGVNVSGESIDAGGVYNNKILTIHLDFEIHKKYTKIYIDYVKTGKVGY